MYNLLDEKWMIGVTSKGQTEPASIRDCFFEDFKNVKSPDFHGYHFYLYDYLAIRLLSTIAADILIYAAHESTDEYDESVEQVIIRELKRGCITDQFKRFAEKYFKQYHNRFELLDDKHPFMQVTKMKSDSKDKSMQLNPLAPADSGRIFPESFHSTERVEIIHGFFNKKEIGKKIQNCFVTTPQEAVYILMYQASIAPGVGAGNKSALAGNAYVFETLNGASLYETILLNIPITGYLLDDEEEPVDFGTPIWRWNSIEEKEGEILTKGKIKVLDGMFFPSKRIHLAYDGERVTINDENIPKQLGKLFDELRNLWAQKQEPQALIAQAKNTDSKEKKNPYRKILPGDTLWLLFAATAQTEQTTLQEKRGKKVVDVLQSAGASHHVQELSKTNVLPEVVEVRYYYRMASDKWVYFRNGCVDGKIPKPLLEEPVRQAYLRKMTEYIMKTKLSLRRCCKTYLANASGSLSKDPSDDLCKRVDTAAYEKSFMDSIQDVFLGESSFLVEVCTSCDLDQTYEEWKKKIKQKALEQFSKLMNQNRMEAFWHYYERLRKEFR